MQFITLILLCAAQLTNALPPSGQLAATNAASAGKLTMLLNKKQYLEFELALQDAHELTRADRDFFSGVLANRKNNTAESVRMLEPLGMAPESASGSAERGKELWLTLADDYVKAFQYGRAAEAYAHVLKTAGFSLSDQEKKDISGSFQMYDLMKDFPAQSVEAAGPFTIQTRRDVLGLIEGPVEAGGAAISAIFDTGADASVLAMSRARQLGLKISEKTTPVGGAAGGICQVHVTIIPRLQIGNAVLRNVGAIVMEDQDLYCAPAHFQMEMIVGYPEIAALGCVTFYADGRIGASPSINRPGAEMFMEGNKPLIAAGTGKGARLFNLDTGASVTVLYEPYYGENRDAFAGLKPVPYQVTGVGGAHEVPAFNGVEVPLAFGSTPVVLHNITVLTGPHNTDPEEYFYGNLGQDLLQPLRSWSLDFRSMHFEIDTGTNP